MNRHTARIRCDDLVDGVATALIAVDADLRVDRMNAAAEMMFAVSAGFACGAPLLQALPALGVLEGPIQAALRGREAFMARDVRLARNNGGRNTFVADVSLTPLRPSGFVRIDGRRVDVQTQGDWVARGVDVQVIAVEGTRVLVAPLDRGA